MLKTRVVWAKSAQTGGLRYEFSEFRSLMCPSGLKGAGKVLGVFLFLRVMKWNAI